MPSRSNRLRAVSISRWRNCEAPLGGGELGGLLVACRRVAVELRPAEFEFAGLLGQAAAAARRGSPRARPRRLRGASARPARSADAACASAAAPVRCRAWLRAGRARVAAARTAAGPRRAPAAACGRRPFRSRGRRASFAAPCGPAPARSAARRPLSRARRVPSSRCASSSASSS